ncbi:DegT/DnrJ/EryC1/StrS family aminotransferase, partial [Candidatus Saccharibacteria bacterium]|nr:DegT/DnrJ/EryC1/StrS family aminotransferase [Candidatus Saccharibacteria bacterium]
MARKKAQVSSKLFLGQASNYRAKDVLKHTFAIGSKKCSNNLKQLLATDYHTIPENVLLMSNGRSALAQALKTLLEPGSGVIINGFTCYAVVQAVKFAKMEPIYADIDEKT